MRFLLDTHTLLWCLRDAPVLKARAREIITDPQNLIYVSPVNTWEIIIKKRLGKLEVPDNLELAIAKSNFIPIPVSIKHTLYIEKLANHHRDPFDRLLIAQAIVEDLTIITRDSKIMRYTVPVIEA